MDPQSSALPTELPRQLDRKPNIRFYDTEPSKQRPCHDSGMALRQLRTAEMGRSERRSRWQPQRRARVLSPVHVKAQYHALLALRLPSTFVESFVVKSGSKFGTSCQRISSNSLSPSTRRRTTVLCVGHKL